MAEYRVYLDDELLCKTDWPPLAQAAWDRASRDRDGAQHGGLAVLLKDEREIASIKPQTGKESGWPDRSSAPATLRDVAAAVIALARVAEAPVQAIAAELSIMGLPAAPARLKSITTLQAGRRSSVSQAEIIAVCYAAIGVIKKRGRAPEPLEQTPDALRAWRARLGLTQQQAAELLGVTRDAVARWESGANQIDRRTAIACAAIEYQFFAPSGAADASGK